MEKNSSSTTALSLFKQSLPTLNKTVEIVVAVAKLLRVAPIPPRND
jgi:hypothetical protein